MADVLQRNLYAGNKLKLDKYVVAFRPGCKSYRFFAYSVSIWSIFIFMAIGIMYISSKIFAWPTQMELSDTLLVLDLDLGPWTASYNLLKAFKGK